MLDPNFQLPDPDVARAETQRRNQLIDWFAGYSGSATTALLVSGSMSYGRNHSVTPRSDIDMQLAITPKTIPELVKLDRFEPEQMRKATDGYLAGHFEQFSLTFQEKGVSMECHFWDQDALIAAISYKTSETRRLRSGIASPSTDHGFSFQRDESTVDYYGEMVAGFPVGILPSYREEDGRLYLCRPITNILGIPQVLKSNPSIDRAIQQTWHATAHRLYEAAGGVVDLSKSSIVNALPGMNKMSPEALDAVNVKTVEMLQALQA